MFLSNPPNVSGQSGAPLTFLMVFDQIRGLIKDADDRAAAAMQRGDSILAQQQMLLSGLLGGSLQQLEAAYSRQMNESVDRLQGLEKDAFANLRTSLDKLRRLQNGTARDLAEITRQVHSATTETLSRLPFANKYPAIHGLLTREVLVESDQHPDDIQVLGFFLVDPDLKKSPEIAINGKPITSGVSAFFDRVQIQLPDEVKKELQFVNSPCEPRKTFEVAVKVHYNRTRGVWPLTWKSAAVLERKLKAVPGEVQYEVAIFKTGFSTVEGPVDEAFRVESPNFNWACEENAANHADYELPAGATLVEKHGGWADLGGRWENHGCSVSHAGSRVVGECHVRGGNKNCVLGICDCPGGGHGRVAVWGQVSKVLRTTTKFVNEPLRVSVMRGQERYDTVALGQKQSIEAIKVEMRRLNGRGRCETLADDVILNLEPELKNTKRATSTRGLFEVETDGRQLSIRRQ